MMGLICSPTAEGRSLSGRHVHFLQLSGYRFQNPTGTTFQLLVWTTDTHLCGELRADAELALSWHIRSEEETFVREGDRVYRNNVIDRECVDKRSGNLLSRETLKRNHALVLYEVPEDRIMEEI